MKIVLILLMTFIGAIASLFLKKASNFKDFKSLLLNYHLYLGGGLYLLSAVINIIVLRYMDYSVVLPLTSITYVWTMVIAKMFLGEKITHKKMIGVFLILVGALIISR